MYCQASLSISQREGISQIFPCQNVCMCNNTFIEMSVYTYITVVGFHSIFLCIYFLVCCSDFLYQHSLTSLLCSDACPTPLIQWHRSSQSSLSQYSVSRDPDMVLIFILSSNVLMLIVCLEFIWNFSQVWWQWLLVLPAFQGYKFHFNNAVCVSVNYA